MESRRLLTAGLALLLVTVGVPGLRPAESVEPAPVGAVTVASPRDEAANGALGYWTAARMAAAESRDLVVVGEDGTTRTAGAEPGAVTATRVPRPYTNAPDRMTGVIFGHDSGGDFRCSGAVVTSPNRSLVWTAGHCVYDPARHEWARRVVFVPAYSSAARDGRPYGTWSAVNLFVDWQWADYGNHEVDLGAVVLGPRNGRRIQAVVGAHRIAFNQPLSGTFNAYGYPSRPAPFNGYDLWRCQSPMTGRAVDDGFGPKTIRISCDLKAGAYGGPWLRAIDAHGVGTISSVSSYRLDGQPTALFGPYLGSVARSLYQDASAFVP